MDQESIWLNPIIELPPAVAILVLASILIASLYSVKGALFALLLTVPLQRFIVIPGILGSRFTPHEAAFLSALASILLRRGEGVRLTFPWKNPVGLPLVLLILVGVVSLLGNPFIEVGISELVILAYLCLLMHIIYDAAADSTLAFHAYRAWYLAGAGFCVLSLAGGVLMTMGIETFLMGGPRLIVTFFNPNQAGSFILASVFMFLARASNRSNSTWSKLLSLGLVFCAVGGAYFMQSRATVLGGLTGLAVFLLLRRARISAIAGIAAMVLAGSFGLSAVRKSDEDVAKIYDNRYSEGVDPSSQSAQVRIENWRNGVDAFARSPLVGIGIGTLWLQAPTISGESYQIHNTYLSFLGETGGLGFLLLLVIVVIVIRESVLGIRLARGTAYEDALIGLVPALAALGVFNFFHYGIRARHLWVTMALVFAFRRLAGTARAEAESPTVAPRPVRVSALAKRSLN